VQDRAWKLDRALVKLLLSDTNVIKLTKGLVGH
jgi:hypothetical protein